MILVDGDVLVYRCGFACEKTKYLVTTGQYDPQHVEAESHALAQDAQEEYGAAAAIWSRKEVEPVENAIALVKTVLASLYDKYPDSGEMRIFLSGPNNFRNAIATRAPYKGNRDGQAKPTHYKAIRQYLLDVQHAVLTDGEEADDALGIGMTANPGSVCVSIDKDLLQIPGIHYDWVKKEETKVSPKQGALNFWSQVLSGDSTDNVPGIEGVGPAKARKILEGAKGDKEAWQKVLDAYIKAYGDDGPLFAKETARLVRIRRTPGEVWAPPV